MDGALSASTYYNYHLAPWMGRINSIRSWSARVNNKGQWLQINLGNKARVTGIATQGRRDANQWVTSYVLSYGDVFAFKAYREKRKIRVCNCFAVYTWINALPTKIRVVSKNHGLILNNTFLNWYVIVTINNLYCLISTLCL